MNSAKQKWIWRRILPYGLIWVLVAIVLLFVEQAAIEQHDVVSDTAISLDAQIVVFALLAVFILGLFVGVLEVLFLERLFKSKSFLVRIGYKLIIYTCLFSVIMFITFPIAAAIELETGYLDSRVWVKYSAFLWSITHVSTWFQMTVSLVTSMLYSEVTDYLGPGVFKNFLVGKYNQPVQELRVFMFLDMRASTTIAEQLEHVRYFDFLKKYYEVLSEGVINNGGEVYQYVGDEIVVTWSFDTQQPDTRWLDCFFNMRDDLAAAGEQFENEFAIRPSFKAGVHFGEVTTGVVGVARKEILHTGDVLNVTARLQSLCNAHQRDILLSEDLAVLFKDLQRYQFETIGSAELKGRVEPMVICSVRQV